MSDIDMLTGPEIEITLANRQRAASIGVGPVSSNPRLDRHVSRDEGRAFELHTQTCAGCEYCRPSRSKDVR